MSAKKTLLAAGVIALGMIGLVIYYLITQPPETTVPVKPTPTATTTPVAETAVLVYFGRLDTTQCNEVFGVERKVPSGNPPEEALQALLKGPTEEERSEYFTSIPPGTQLLNFDINNGTATANFSQELSTAAGSCNIQSIRTQIDQTLLQFEDINNVVIEIDGQSKGILEP